MESRPQHDDRSRIRTLRRWYAGLWMFLGLAPMAVAGLDDPAPGKYWSFALPAALAVGHGLVRRFPANPVLPARAFPWVLIAGVGALSYLRGGAASLYVATLPYFWLYVERPRSALRLSSVAAAVTVFCGLLPDGRSPDLLAGNVTATLIACVTGALIGLSVHRFARDNGERVERLSTELDDARLRLAEAYQRQGAAEERERLAREIHDTLAQGFASIIVLAEAARTGIGSDPARSGRQLLSIEQTARENLAEARILVGSVPRSEVAAGSIATTLRRTLDRFTEDTGIPVDSELPDLACDQPTRVALLRCAQESLANVRKHAGASTVGVVLTEHPDGVELEITDDGRGFVVEDAHGFGLDGMRRRLAELGGDLTVTSSVGDGTRILVFLPSDDRT